MSSEGGVCLHAAFPYVASPLLCRLQVLCMDDCGMKSLPAWLGTACPSLTHLNISGSPLLSLDAGCLPPNLVALSASSCKLVALSQDLSRLGLVTDLVSSLDCMPGLHDCLAGPYTCIFLLPFSGSRR